MVIGEDSCLRGHGVESQCNILDGKFSHVFVVKIVLFLKRPKTKKRPFL